MIRTVSNVARTEALKCESRNDCYQMIKQTARQISPGTATLGKRSECPKSRQTGAINAPCTINRPNVICPTGIVAVASFDDTSINGAVMQNPIISTMPRTVRSEKAGKGGITLWVILVRLHCQRPPCHVHLRRLFILPPCFGVFLQSLRSGLPVLAASRQHCRQKHARR